MRADCLPFAEVTVRVNGRDLEEHQTDPAEEENPTKATTYVEGVAGAEFSVKLSLKRGFAYVRDSLTFKVLVDGSHVNSRVLALPFVYWADIGSEVVGAVEGSNDHGSTLRKLRFAAHEMNEAKPKASMNVSSIANLGNIEVQLLRSRQVGASTESSKVDFKTIGKSGIPEKALKGRAVSNHTELGAATRTKESWVRCDYPYGTKPIATYVFKYRSHKDLQIEGIIPRSPSPVPLEERDPDTLTPQEAREVIIRMRAREQNTVKIKQEFKREKRRHSAVSAETGDNDEEEGDISITGEFDRRKRARPENTIDLTADD